MPTYEYRCNKCGYEFEKFQKMSDEAITECPECKGEVKRLISSGGGILFKGTGFYETDYKKKSPSTSKKTTTVSPNTVSPSTKTEGADKS